jgi:hypothetical protein
MHTTKTENAAFIHNGDFSGEIRVIGRDRNGTDDEVILRFKDIKYFVEDGFEKLDTGLPALLTGNVTFISNDGFSKEIRVVGKNRDGGEGEVALDFKDFEDFIAGVIRQELMSIVENAGLENLMLMAEAIMGKLPNSRFMGIGTRMRNRR